MNNGTRQILRLGGLLVFSLVGAAVVTALALYLWFRAGDSPKGWSAKEVAVQPGLSLLLPRAGTVKVRWVSPPLEPVLAARAGVPQLAVDSRGHPWLLHDGARLINPAAQVTAALSQHCRDVVCLPNGALLVATETEWGFLAETREVEEGTVALPTEIFQPLATLPVPRARLFAGATGQLYFSGFSESSREQVLYRIAPEAVGVAGPTVVRRYEQIFASGTAIGAAGGDADTDYFSVEDTIYRRAVKGGKATVVHRQAQQPITGLSVDPVGGVFFATAHGVFRLNEGGALPVAQVEGAQIAARDGSLFVLIPSCVGVLALDHVAELGRVGAELMTAPAAAPTDLRVAEVHFAAEQVGFGKVERGETFARDGIARLDCEVRLTRPSASAKPERHVLLLRWTLPGGRVQSESQEFELLPRQKKTVLTFSRLECDGAKFYPGSYTVTASLDAGEPLQAACTVTGEPDLADAVLAGETATARRLLQAGADANGATSAQQPLLLVALEGGSAALTEVLLKYGANPDLADETGRTPLFHAVEETVKEAPEKVRLLLAYRATIEARDRDGFTPLTHGVTQGGSRAAVEVLLANHAAPDALDEAGRTPLYTLLQMTGADDRQETFVPVLLKAGADVNCTEGNGVGALTALLHGSCSTPCVRTLIAHGVDVNATAPDPRAMREEPSSCLAIALATYRENMETNRPLAQRAMAAVQMLIDAGAKLQPDEEALVIEPEFCSWLDENFIASVLRGNEKLFSEADEKAYVPHLRTVLVALLMERMSAQVVRANSREELHDLLPLCGRAATVMQFEETKVEVKLSMKPEAGPTQGMRVAESDSYCRVVRVDADSPAAAAGIEAGDHLVQVAENGIFGFTKPRLAELLAKQPAGSSVEVRFSRLYDTAVPEIYFWCGALEWQLAQSDQAEWFLRDQAELNLRIYLRLGKNPEALAQARAWIAELERR